MTRLSRETVWWCNQCVTVTLNDEKECYCTCGEKMHRIGAVENVNKEDTEHT